MGINFFSHVFIRSSTHSFEWINQLSCKQTIQSLNALFALEQEFARTRDGLIQKLHELVGSSSSDERAAILKVKREVTQSVAESYAFPSSFPGVELSPQLREQWKKWTDLGGKRLHLLSESRKTFEAELDQIRASLKEVLANRHVQEGILLSSQSLYEGLKRYLDLPSTAEKGAISKAHRQFERNIMEHLLRACLSTVPRGLLTGVRACELSSANQMSENKDSPVEIRRTLLSLPVVRELAREISRSKDVWKRIVPRPNPTFYQSDGKIFFWRIDPQTFEESLAALPAVEPILRMLEIADRRVLRADELIHRISQDLGEEEYSSEMVTETYHKLNALGLLIGDLEIPFERIDGLGFVREWVNANVRDLLPDTLLKRIDRLSELLHILDRKYFEKQDSRFDLYFEISELLGNRPVDQVIVADVLVSERRAEILPSHLESLRRILQASLEKTEGISTDALVTPAIDPAILLEGKSELPVMEVFRAASTELGRLKPTPQGACKTKHGTDIPSNYGVIVFSLADLGKGEPKLIFDALFPGFKHLTRFGHLFEDDDNPVLLAIKAQTELRRRCVAGLEFAEVLHSPLTRLATAAWFPSVEKYAVEVLGPPSSRDRSEIIPLRELKIATDESGKVSLIWTKTGSKIVLIRENNMPVSIIRWIQFLPVFRPLWIASEPEKTNAEWRFTPEGWTTLEPWELQRQIQRLRFEQGIPRWVSGFAKFDDSEQWQEIGFLDMENPLVLQGLMSTCRRLEEKEKPFQLRFLEFLPPTGGGVYRTQYWMPYFYEP